MESEIDSLHTKKVWDIAEIPSGQKVMGSKWMFKQKFDANRHMEQHKTQLVARGTIRC